MKLSEIKPGGHIEAKVEIIEMQPERKLWYCNINKHKGMWLKGEEKDECPECGGKQLWIQRVTSAIIKDVSGTCYLDLWKDDIDKYKIGDKIRIINGFAKISNTGHLNLSKGKYGSIQKNEP